MSSFASKAMSESSFLAGPRPIVPPGPVPIAVDKHYDFLDWSPDGESLFLGTSELTSRSWAGSIWVFNSKETQCANNNKPWRPQADECVVGASMDCGVTVGRFMRCPDRLVVGCDSGAVQVIGLRQYGEATKLEGEGSLSEHNDTVLDIDDLGGEGVEYVTCSQDKSIKVWDLDVLISTRTFSPAHAHIVTSVRAQPSQSKCFASCARDGSALLWDIRDDNPASKIMDPCGVGLTSLAWVDETNIVVGGVSGQLIVIDIRNISDIKFKLQLDHRPVHSLKSIPDNGLVGVCQDNSKVSVAQFEGESPQILYSNDSHGDFVRGLSWHPQNFSLWSCGWDSYIMPHIPRSVNGST
ncbi:methylosome protein 50 isoform X2 [Thrips palmi]|uniref:Methylosome protein 50 isoform X2 n=1 Tax=Thrips palmi TaxID=161013 RepID=A0A6P9AHA6_THRPL|nr:methylosome protein 50 isoform X2 [Thrips palmi]